MPKTGKYLLKAGLHADDNGVFQAGDIVQSETNLAERWPEKFGTPPPSDPKTAAEAAETRDELLAKLRELDAKFPPVAAGGGFARRPEPVPNMDPLNPPSEAKDQAGPNRTTRVPSDANTGDLDDPEPTRAANRAGGEEPDYESMTVAELKQRAEDEEVDVPARATKAEYIKALQGAKK